MSDAVIEREPNSEGMVAIGLNDIIEGQRIHIAGSTVTLVITDVTQRDDGGFTFRIEQEHNPDDPKWTYYSSCNVSVSRLDIDPGF